MMVFDEIFDQWTFCFYLLFRFWSAFYLTDLKNLLSRFKYHCGIFVFILKKGITLGPSLPSHPISGTVKWIWRHKKWRIVASFTLKYHFYLPKRYKEKYEVLFDWISLILDQLVYLLSPLEKVALFLKNCFSSVSFP